MGLLSESKSVQRESIARVQMSLQQRTLPQSADADGSCSGLSEQLKLGRGSTYRYRETNVAVFRLDSGLFAIDDAALMKMGLWEKGTSMVWW